MDTENGRDNSPPEGGKPIIDQMTELAAQAAGTLAETAVKAGAKKAKKAVARRLPGPVKKAAKTIARAAKTGSRKTRATKSRATKARATKARATKARATKSSVAKARATSKKTVKKTAKKSSTRSSKTGRSRAQRSTVGKKTAARGATKKPVGGEAADGQRIVPPMCHSGGGQFPGCLTTQKCCWSIRFETRRANPGKTPGWQPAQSRASNWFDACATGSTLTWPFSGAVGECGTGANGGSVRRQGI